MSGFYPVHPGGGVSKPVTWDTLPGKPVAAPAEIDDAAAKRHAHANQSSLVKFGEVNGKLQYDGKDIAASLPGTFGGSFSTKADILAAALQIGYNYVVDADESQGGARTYYNYAVGGVLQYLGSYSDNMVAGGGNGGYSRQWNSPGTVVTNGTKDLAIPNTTTFTVLPPAVLAFEAGATDIVTTACEFDNGSASSFAYDAAAVEFIGTGSGSGSQMRLKTTYVVDFTKQAPAGGAEYASALWDFGLVKLTESVVVV